jgi:phage FluMu gp28-like protein
MPGQLESQIHRLLSKDRLNDKEAHRLTLLTRSYERLHKLAPKPKPSKKTETLKPKVKVALSQDLLQRFLAEEYGLYPYQKAFLLSERRFIKVLKARQIGYSYGCLAPKALLRALAGRNQLIVSASEYQSQIVLNYVKTHIERLGLENVVDDADSKSISIAGAKITALPTNFRTIQGNPGDVILDEFAWYHNQKRIWEAIVPSITQIGGTITVCSTPFVPGNFFWQLITEHDGRFTNFESHRITIHDAVAQGMPLPGGIEELRSLFDGDSWKMLYECQWAEDGSALLSWDMLHGLATEEETRFWDGPVYMGVDVGRVNDRFCIANVGRCDDGSYRLLHLELHKNINFPHMRGLIEQTLQRYEVKRCTIDRTGLGMQLAEDVVNAHPSIAQSKHFSREVKEKLALNLLKLCEDKQLRFYNDPALISQLHAVKKHATSTGIRYDAQRDETGHADAFWALALAVSGLSKGHYEENAIVELL